MYSFYESEKNIFFKKLDNNLIYTTIKLINEWGRLQGMLEILYQCDKITTDIFLSENKELRNRIEIHLHKLNSQGD